MVCLTIAERSASRVTILDLAGRLVLEDGAVVLRDHINRLVAQGRINLVLDMREVTHLDSGGIGMLVAKYLSVQRKGGSLKLLHLTPRSAHLLTITKLCTVFESFESEDEALRSFDTTPA